VGRVGLAASRKWERRVMRVILAVQGEQCGVSDWLLQVQKGRRGVQSLLMKNGV
jgi:hypothetical protein